MATQPPAVPIANLQAQLDDVVAYIDECVAFRSRLFNKLYWSKVFMLLVRFPKAFWGVLLSDPMSGKATDLGKLVFASASDKEKSSEFFGLCSSDYPLHALALKLISRFPNYKFQPLAKLHGTMDEKLKFTYWQLIGFIVAVASFMLKDIPEAVVKNQLGIPDMPTFQGYVLGEEILIVAYLSICFVWPWYRIRRAKVKHSFIGTVLNYVTLVETKEASIQPEKKP